MKEKELAENVQRISAITVALISDEVKKMGLNEKDYAVVLCTVIETVHGSMMDAVKILKLQNKK